MSTRLHTASKGLSDRERAIADSLINRARDGSVEVARPLRRRGVDRRGGPAFITPRRSLDALRHSPVRNGLIGLAVVGTAAPLAVHRYQQALRTDPSHELALAQGIVPPYSDETVGGIWLDLLADAEAAASLRENVVRENLERYSDFALTKDLAEEIYDVAIANDIDPEIAFGLVKAESSFRNTSTSPVGAIGLTQLMPRTAAWLEPGVTRAELREPKTNLRIGFSYLRSLIDKYGGNEDLALVAYNRGPGTVDRELKRGRDPDNGYAAFVRGAESHGHTLYTRK